MVFISMDFRKLIGFLVPLFISAQLACAQAPANGAIPDKAEYVWDRLDIFKINKEEPRAFFLTFPDFKSASKNIEIDDLGSLYSGSSYRLLNGDWKFFFAENPGDVKPEFFRADFDDSAWDDIDVPNSWQCRGYDRIFYANTLAEFQFDKKGAWIPGYRDQTKDNPPPATLKPSIPEMHRQSGIYRRSFSMPEAWNGGLVFVRFNGVRTGFNLYVNGKFVGYSEDSFTPAEFNITPFLKKGENSMAVEVFKYSTGAYFEMQDMPHMVGIIRDVMLVARPQTYIRDYFAPAKISADMKSAEIDFSAELANSSPAPAKNCLVEAFVIDSDGRPLGGKPVFSGRVGEIAPGGKALVSGRASVGGFKLWSPDKPNLYAILIRLSDASGRELETVRADYAFKKFEVAGSDILLNGKSLLIKGVNRHDWSPDKGKACSLDWMKKDVELMKRANVNFVRTSHYPNDDVFYMLCSRYGIAVLDENNHEQHGFIESAPLDLDHFIPPSLDRMKNMVVRDRNVPCVAIFSLGNESSVRLTKGHEKMAALSRELSPAHPVHSEPEARVVVDGRNGGFSDFVSPMYGGVSRMKGYLRLEKETRPFFFCEYAHAMGNGIGNLKGKWDLIRSLPGKLHGGFIWDWVDQGLYREMGDGSGRVYISDGRDWNTSPSAGNFSLNGIVYADRTHSPKYDEVRRVYQSIQVSAPDGAEPGKLAISNEFVDTDLAEFAGEVVVERDGEKIAEAALPPMKLAPGASSEFEIPLPAFDASKPGEYFYSVIFSARAASPYAPAGYVVSKTQLPLFKKDFEAEIPAKGSVSVRESQKSVSLRAGATELVFDRGSAELSSFKIDGRDFLKSPLRFDISSAFIDNEARGECSRAEKEYGLDSMRELGQSVRIEKLSPSCVRAVCRKTFAGADGAGFFTESVYTLLGSGAFEVSVSARKLNDTPRSLSIPRLGVAMGTSPEYSSVEFFGRGPLANYNDRCESADVGRYKSDISQWSENFTRVQDTGNREEVRWLALRDAKGQGAVFSAAADPLPMALLPHTQAEMKKAAHPHDLPASSGGELRIAWKVRGLGNSSCGPATREQFRPDFEGSASWAFVVAPLRRGADAASVASMKFPEKFSFRPAAETENLQDDSLMPARPGAWISEGAKVSYSSRDARYAPKSDTLTSSGEGAFAFHTQKEENPWLVIDLGRERKVMGAEIVNRSDAQGSRTSRLWMSVSQDGKNWRDVWHSDDTRRRWNAVLEKPENARYVRIQMRKNEIFHLKRVRIFGE